MQENNQENVGMKSIKLINQEGFAVQPITTCTHMTNEQLININKHVEADWQSYFNEKCMDCENIGENWVCLYCEEIYCSRFVQSHMLAHNQNTKHHVVFSFADFSFWCYTCDAYITNHNISLFTQFLSFVRFGQNNQEDQLPELIEQITNLKIQEPLTRDSLVKKLKEKKFHRIVFLTGAGITTAAGIPDFKSLQYLEQFNLPSPEVVYETKYFQKEPQIFYKVAKQFIQKMKTKPTLAHKFQKKIQDNGQLHYCFTSNIDGLELEAGIKEDKLIQAHGNFKSSHCTQCNEEFDNSKMLKAIEKEEIQRCQKCKTGLVKPDIVLFGDQLPPRFYNSWQMDISIQIFRKKAPEADLVIIMGTNLKVMPFAMIPELIPDEVPFLVFNNQNCQIQRSNIIFLYGEIEATVKQLADDLNWKL